MSEPVALAWSLAMVVVTGFNLYFALDAMHRDKKITALAYSLATALGVVAITVPLVESLAR